MNMKAWLKEQQDNFDEQALRAATEQGFENPPDGKYVMKLIEAELGESKSSGRVQIAWKWEIVESADEAWIGKTKFDYDGLERDDAFVWLCRKLKKFGYDPTELKLSKIEATLDELVDRHPYIKARLKTKNDFQNMSIECEIEDYEEVESSTSQSSSSSSDIELKPGMNINVDMPDSEDAVIATIVELKPNTDELVIKIGRKVHTVGIGAVIGVAE